MSQSRKEASASIKLLANTKNCFMLNRGRMCELINYWHYLGVDQALLGRKYIDMVKQMDEG